MEHEITNDVGETTGAPAQQSSDERAPEQERALVARILSTIKSDKKYHEKAFGRMKRDMRIAWHGADTKTWADTNYRANISGRLVKQKVAALYAKNPKAVAKRKERLDFAVWDESPESLVQAYQIVQQGQAMLEQAALAAVAPAVHVMPDGSTMLDSDMPSGASPELGGLDSGIPSELGGPAPPQMPPGYEEATALIADFQQGMERRKLLDKLAKTLELLFANAMREQQPLDFKSAMKQVVRRGYTTSVGYVELDFQRETGPRPGVTEQLTDYRERLAHLQRLGQEIQEGDIQPADAEVAEIEKSMAALAAEPEVVTREGLVFDFPRATKVIPDRRTKALLGFVGADHLTLEYDYTAEKIKEIFQVDLGKNFTPYQQMNALDSEADYSSLYDDDTSDHSGERRRHDLVRVWKHYDKPSGLVYYVVDGHLKFLQEPAAPNVFVEEFWPVYALTFNECESETDLFPPSDVALIQPMQEEYNRSRQGKREHRQAARPRWVYARNSFDEDDLNSLKTARPFEAIGMSLAPGSKLADQLQTIPVPGVDPNLYDVGEIVTDLQLVVGIQEASLGGLAKATATESSISAASTATTDGSNVDDLDSFLTRIARAGGAILLKEMSEAKVKEQVGPGAVWPHMTLADIAGELYLEVEAGSTGRPNQAVELNNWKTMLPFLIQIGSIKPEWLARESLRRLDDRMDLTDALSHDIPAIVALNRNAQPGPADPGAAPDAQGPEGADKTAAPKGLPTGSGAAFGSNQV